MDILIVSAYFPPNAPPAAMRIGKLARFRPVDPRITGVGAGDERYRSAAAAANVFVRRTIALDGADNIRGGVKGSFPVDGAYGRFEFLNWAAKFAIDSNLHEQNIG